MSFISDSFHLFVRWMKKLVRNPILIFFSLFQPVIFLVLFTQLFSKFGQLLGPGVSYTVFATAGIVLQNAFSSAFQSGTAVVDDIKSGFLTKMLATPVNRSAILFGRILSDMFRVAVQTIIILALAYVLGVYPQTGVPGYVLVILTVGFFGLAWSGISLALGLKTKSGETVFGIAGFLTFPLLFMSTALVDPTSMPPWMQTVSSYNPISFAVNAIRSLIMPPPHCIICTNVFDWSTILQAYGVIALIGVVTLGATLYLCRKDNNTEDFHRYDPRFRRKSPDQRHRSASQQEESLGVSRSTHRESRDLPVSHTARSIVDGCRAQRIAQGRETHDHRRCSCRGKDGRMAGQEGWKVLQGNEAEDQYCRSTSVGPGGCVAR